MRVLVVTNMYPPHHLGGYELTCRDVVERWRRAGHHVEVLTGDLALAGIETPPGERATGIRRDLRLYWRDPKIVDPGPLGSLRIERHNRKVLDEALREVRPDVVSAWHMGALSLSLLSDVRTRDIPLVLVVCDDWMIYGPQVDGWLRRFGRGRTVRAITGAIACFVSPWISNRALERSPIKPARSTVTPTGIDTDDFPIAEPGSRAWRGRLLCVGRVEERKGVHIAIEALAQLPDTTLTISGPADDSYLPRLRTLADDLGVGDRVTFTVTPRDALHTLYASADAYLFPIVWDEPFGLTPLEAMACATPVVATVRGGSRDFLIDGANCLEVPSGDADAVAAAVRRLAADPELREGLVRGGLATASELTIDRYAKTLEDWHLWAAGATTRAPSDPASVRDVLAARGVT